MKRMLYLSQYQFEGLGRMLWDMNLINSPAKTYAEACKRFSLNDILSAEGVLDLPSSEFAGVIMANLRPRISE